MGDPGGSVAGDARGQTRVRRYRDWRLWAAVAVFAAVLAWWFTQARAFAPYADVLAVGGDELPVGEPVHVDTGVYPDGLVEVISIEPVIAAGKLIDVSLKLCNGGPRGGVGNFIGDLHPVCATPRPLVGATLGRHGEQSVMSFTVAEPGPVRIEGFVVTYRTGSRFGRQHTGAAMEWSETATD
jgi:hypothetical protein